MEMVFAHADELEWVDGPYPKTTMKIFPSAPSSGTYTILLRVPAGATLERHEEPLNEVFYILSGTGIIEGKKCEEGTYLFTPAGTEHGPFTTEGGCLFLVTKFTK
jgi:mannose-6-phosphate isomerase-like protein (cupin superfamily)